MGCGTLDWADLYDHVAELLPEEEDAAVREHLAKCDSCRADSGELMVLSEGLMALGVFTHVTGREQFADRTRQAVREAMGERGATRSTTSWRVSSSGETQRLKRIQVRRHAYMRTLLRTLALAVAVVVGLGCLFHWLGATHYAVDTLGPGIERLTGLDFARMGLRPTFEATAGAARAAEDGAAISSLADPVQRLLRREFSELQPRAGAIVSLEFASQITARGDASDGELIARLLEEAASAEAVPASEFENGIALVRKARKQWKGGNPKEARETLLLLAVEQDPLAIYYSAQASVARPKDFEEAARQLAAAAVRMPAVWAEISWRWLALDRPDMARLAADSMADGPAAEEIRRRLSAD